MGNPLGNLATGLTGIAGAAGWTSTARALALALSRGYHMGVPPTAPEFARADAIWEIRPSWWVLNTVP